MTVKVTSVYSGSVWTASGTPEEVRARIYTRFPWVLDTDRPDGTAPRTLQDILTRLNSSQALSVEVTEA